MNTEKCVKQLQKIRYEKAVLMKYDIADQREVEKWLQEDIDALTYAIEQIGQKSCLPFVWVRGKFPSANDYIRACRASPQVGAKVKKEQEQLICYQLARMPRITVPIIVHFEWHEKDHRRDKDNVAFAKKFILDAMQKAGKIPNDDSRYIAGFTDCFVYGDDYGVLIRIQRVKE